MHSVEKAQCGEKFFLNISDLKNILSKAGGCGMANAAEWPKEVIKLIIPGRPYPAVRLEKKKNKKLKRRGEAYNNYKSFVREHAINQVPPSCPIQDQLLEAKIFVYVTPPVGDEDNYSKSIKDALNGIVWEDDGQVRACKVVVHQVEKQLDQKVIILVRNFVEGWDMLT